VAVSPFFSCPKFCFTFCFQRPELRLIDFSSTLRWRSFSCDSLCFCTTLRIWLPFRWRPLEQKWSTRELLIDRAFPPTFLPEVLALSPKPTHSSWSMMQSIFPFRYRCGENWLTDNNGSENSDSNGSKRILAQCRFGLCTPRVGADKEAFGVAGMRVGNNSALWWWCTLESCSSFADFIHKNFFLHETARRNTNTHIYINIYILRRSNFRQKSGLSWRRQNLGEFLFLEQFPFSPRRGWFVSWFRFFVSSFRFRLFCWVSLFWG